MIAAFTALLAAECTLAQGPNPAKMEVLSVEIHKPPPADVDENIVSSFNGGTRINLLVRLPDKFIVTVDGKLNSVTDDKGTDLLKTKIKKGIGSPVGFSPLVEINRDGKCFANEVRGPGVPVPGATRIHLKGQLVVKCGIDEKTAEAKNVVLDDKLNVKIGPL